MYSEPEYHEQYFLPKIMLTIIKKIYRWRTPPIIAFLNY